MPELTKDAKAKAKAAAEAQGFSAEAGEAMLAALIAGGGRQAQFNRPEFGGMGQWSGGMTQIGDMFNDGLKARVAALASDLAKIAGDGEALFEAAGSDHEGTASHGSEWPAELGHASSTGSQNDMAYAVFPESRRLAIRTGGKVKIYDTGAHRIGGVSQSQSGSQSLAFTSQDGQVRLEDLPLVSG